MNIEELVRAALVEATAAEPTEAGAYDRFLRRRRRQAWRAAGSAGVAVALVLTLVVGGAWLVRRPPGTVAGPAPATGTVRFPRQGFALTPPAGWQVNREGTERSRQAGRTMLGLSPIGGDRQTRTRITVHTEVAYPITTLAGSGPVRTACSGSRS